MKPTLALALSAALLASAGAAQADCNPVIAAYLKADATKRYAVFEVDSMAKAPKGDPFLIVVGDAEYQPNMVRKGPLNIVIDGYKKGPFVSSGEADSLRDRERKGKVRCEPLGDGKVGADAVVGYRIRSNDKGNQEDPTAIDIWLGRATGLPAWHGMGSDSGGFRWVYGTAVVAPTPDKK